MWQIGYGDYIPDTELGRAIVFFYLPISVAALAQGLTQVSAINVRRGIRETDYGEKLAAEFLRNECVRNATPLESMTEAE